MVVGANLTMETHAMRDHAEITFHQVTAAQTRDVLDVLDEAAGRLHARGIEQWPQRFAASWVEEAIAEGHTWLVYVDGVIAGTVTLDWSDPLWEDVDGTAGYLHRMAVRRAAAGVGAHVLAWARSAAVDRGVAALRLDCVRSNDRLRAYYEGNGFLHRGDVPVGGAPGQRRDDGPVTWVSRYELALPRRP